MTTPPSSSALRRASRPSGGRPSLVLFALALLAAPPSRADDPAAPAAPPPARADDPVTPAPPPPARSVGEATVTAARGERGVLETPGNVTVIDRAAIDRSAARDVPELLRREAGIYVTNTTSTPQGYNVEARGFANGSGGGSSMLVLIDGRRANEPSSSAMDWALLHLDDVERIEIVRGPTSALYGDNAVGGTIQILTKQGDGKPRFEARARYGSYDTYGGSLFAGGTAGPVSASLFTDYDSTLGYRDRSGYRTRDVEGRLRFALGERIALGVAGGYTSDRREFPGALSSQQIRELGRRAADPSLDENGAGVRTRYASATLEVTPIDDLLVTFSPYTMARQDRTASGDPTFVFDADVRSDADGLNAQVQLDRPLGPLASRLVVGTDLGREDSDSDSTFTFDPFPPSVTESRSTRETFGVYLQEELHLTDDVLLSGGVRYDQASYRLEQEFVTDPPTPKSRLDRRLSVWSPRAALTWRILDALSAYASWSRGFRFPSLDETAGFFSANPLLDPQKSNAYEIGAKWRSERVTGGLAFYWMDVHDEILLDSEVIQFGFLGVQNVNIDRVNHRGIEASLAVRPIDWIELYGSYTLDDSRVRRDSITNLDGKRVPITPVHRGTLGFVVTLPFRFDVGMNLNLVGSRYLANDFSNDLQKLSPFAVYDLVAGWRPRLLDERLELDLTFAVRNLFDREYVEFGGRRTFVPVGAQAVAFFPSPTRRFEGGVTIRVRP